MVAHERGCLTIAFAPVGAGWEFDPRSPIDPFVRQELAESLYHLAWELVHVFFDHRGLLEGRDARGRHDAGAASFLYPFLAEDENDLHAVLSDVQRSVLMKAGEIERPAPSSDPLREGGRRLRRLRRLAFRHSTVAGTLLVFGNGGSATDAMDAVADSPLPAPWLARADVLST